MIFAHVPPNLRRAVHSRVVEGLRPGGVLILEAYAPDRAKKVQPPVEQLNGNL